ncbi:hypothetical protein EF847_01655 [Actinobacteria bacterium YIM 96077]|uniref:Uncharacterized protein n=1 Tax=Phytoactinopolyspora halophila TaxID=1981511 RepID=A0A329QGT4_9ACTN|nr:hypothetical protein [Phytoactinopolyspora halophila]AYY11625.1 hypothetical protein EF847_01655 [Actinobacteria bacterium YIM 96077]RAW11171.1 hypothetical protein DPM12_17680 [Phytoactinopolyspora halophila]
MEKTVLVCDLCGAEGATRVVTTIDNSPVTSDLCHECIEPLLEIRQAGKTQIREDADVLTYDEFLSLSGGEAP